MHFPVKIKPSLFAKVKLCEPLCSGLLLVKGGFHKSGLDGHYVFSSDVKSTGTLV